MDSEEEFTQRLLKFGLSKKEARLYFHLLKYGPNPPSLLAKSLETYITRNIPRRCLPLACSLVDKGTVTPSFGSPTIYAAVDLDTALDAALKKHQENSARCQ